MKTYTKNFKIVKIERLKNSIYGNPKYKLYVVDSNGKQHEGKTASNNPISRRVQISDVNKIYSFNYHYTKKGNIIFDIINYEVNLSEIRKNIKEYKKLVEEYKKYNQEFYKKCYNTIIGIGEELKEAEKEALRF